jgi:hypothetical protein
MLKTSRSVDDMFMNLNNATEISKPVFTLKATAHVPHKSLNGPLSNLRPTGILHTITHYHTIINLQNVIAINI